MVSPLEGSIAKTIGKAFTSIFYDCTLTRSTSGSGDAWNPGASTLTEYPCKGMVGEYTDFERQNTLIETNDRKITILAASLSVEPKQTDTVTIRGETFTVIRAKTDPAKATWTVQARK